MGGKNPIRKVGALNAPNAPQQAPRGATAGRPMLVLIPNSNLQFISPKIAKKQRAVLVRASNSLKGRWCA